MAGAYLDFFPQDTYTLTSNVLLSNVAQELYQSTVWFTAASDQWSFANPGSLFINLCSTTGNIAISNNNTNVNSVITVTLPSALTANFSYVNSAWWSLVVKTTTNAVYTVDRGRCSVSPRPAGVSYQ